MRVLRVLAVFNSHIVWTAVETGTMIVTLALSRLKVLGISWVIVGKAHVFLITVCKGEEARIWDVQVFNLELGLGHSQDHTGGEFHDCVSVTKNSDQLNCSAAGDFSIVY